MNIKMAINSQLSTTESKKKTKQTKQTTRTGTESQIWRLFGGLPVGRGKRRIGGKIQEFRSIIGQVENRQGYVKNSIGNGEAKELTCMTHTDRTKGDCWREEGYWVEGGKIETIVIA